MNKVDELELYLRRAVSKLGNTGASMTLNNLAAYISGKELTKPDMMVSPGTSAGIDNDEVMYELANSIRRMLDNEPVRIKSSIEPKYNMGKHDYPRDAIDAG